MANILAALSNDYEKNQKAKEADVPRYVDIPPFDPLDDLNNDDPAFTFTSDHRQDSLTSLSSIPDTNDAPYTHKEEEDGSNDKEEGCCDKDSLNHVKESLNRYNISLFRQQKSQASLQSYAMKSTNSLSREGIALVSRHSGFETCQESEPLVGGHNATFADFTAAPDRISSNCGNIMMTAPNVFKPSLAYTRNSSKVSLSSQGSASCESSGSSLSTMHLQRMSCKAKHRPPIGFKKVATMRPSSSSAYTKFMTEQELRETNGSSSSLSKLLNSRSFAFPKEKLTKSSMGNGSVAGKFMLRRENTPRTRNPQDYYANLLRSRGIEVVFRPSLLVEEYFVHPSMEDIESYDDDIISAIKTQDIMLLRKMHVKGRSLQCCNSFGESLIHLACQLGLTDVTTFLVKEAGVSVRAIDDNGRTPLHDACWTPEPNPDLVELLIREEPDLLLMTDKKGHAPLQYLRTEDWGLWVKFLASRHDMLLPKYFAMKKFASSIW